MPDETLRERVLEALKTISYPGFSRDIVSFGLVQDLAVRQGEVSFRLKLATQDPGLGPALVSDCRKVAGSVPGVSSVRVDVRTEAPMRLPTAAPPGPAPLLRDVGRVIAVASGKGGVGKSTVAVNLALALARAGRRVGLLDADIYGPSIPLMFGLEGTRPEVQDNRAVPLEKFGVRMISIGFFLGRDDPVVWRGPMVMKAIEQLLGDVAWGKLDDLIVDLPPGTGDAQLTLSQRIRLEGVVIVTTPNDLALRDAVKGVAMFRKVEVPVLGIIENMSSFVCPHCGETSHVFSSGGARRECERLAIPFLGEVPLHPAIRAGGDEGRPVMVSDPESAHARAFLELAERLMDRGAGPPPPEKGVSFFKRFSGRVPGSGGDEI